MAKSIMFYTWDIASVHFFNELHRKLELHSCLPGTIINLAGWLQSLQIFNILITVVRRSYSLLLVLGFPGSSAVNNPPANSGDTGLIPRSGRSPARGHGNPLQYSCLENPTDRGTWQATVHWVAKESVMIQPLKIKTNSQYYLPNLI